MAEISVEISAPAPGKIQFSFVVLIFFRYSQNRQFSATKTTIVVFRQHDPQSVAMLFFVAATPLMAPQQLQTQKNDVSGGISVENSSPSTIWGVEISGNPYFLDLQ